MKNIFKNLYYCMSCIFIKKSDKYVSTVVLGRILEFTCVWPSCSRRCSKRTFSSSWWRPTALSSWRSWSRGWRRGWRQLCRMRRSSLGSLEGWSWSGPGSRSGCSSLDGQSCSRDLVSLNWRSCCCLLTRTCPGCWWGPSSPCSSHFPLISWLGFFPVRLLPRLWLPPAAARTHPYSSCVVRSGVERIQP